MVFNPDNYNKHSFSEACYYDLSYTHEEIKGDGNFIVRLAGNTIKQIIPTNKNENVPVIPVGITLSIPAELFSDELIQGRKSLGISSF